MAVGALLSIGHGYSAAALARRLVPLGWRVMGTTRSAETAERVRAAGVEPLLWPLADPEGALAAADHLLSSIAPEIGGDPALDALGPLIAARAPALKWAGYLSTVGVYGDRGGAWVDEDAPLAPATERGLARVAAERAWLRLGEEHGLPLHVFRLAGIYGPGRGPFEKLRRGTAQRVVKPGQVFSRIHPDDIAQTLLASMAHPNPGRIYNVCDDEPAPPQDVIAHAARLLNLPPPPEVDYETADLSPMARSFYAESKRVSNRRLRGELGVTLLYPTYREGLAAVLAAEG